MSEQIAKIGDYEVKADTLGRVSWYENGTGRVAEEEALRSFGVDPTQRQEPVEAMWRGEAVTVVGIYGRFDDEDLLKTEGGLGIPRSELEFLEKKAAAEIESSDDVAKLRQQLEAERQAHKEEIRQLKESFSAEMTAMKTQLEDDFKRQIDELKRQISDNAPRAVLVPYQEGLAAKTKRMFNRTSTPPDQVYIEADTGRRYYETEGEKVYIEEDRKGGKKIAAVALAVGALALGLASCERLEDEDKQGDGKTLVIKENETKIAQERLEVDKERLEAEQMQAEEAAEANDIARQELAARQRANQLAIQQNRLLDDLREELGTQGLGTAGTAQRGNQVDIEPGHGFTHEIRQLFPGYSPSQYYAAHLAAVARFGPNYVFNVPKYRTDAGDIRFSRPGNAMIMPKAKIFIGDFLKNNFR